MKSVVVDTDILINFLRGRETARGFLSLLVNEATLYCSVITVAEIFSGMRELFLPWQKECEKILWQKRRFRLGTK